MFKNFFEGWYFKHQNEYETVAIIPGISAFSSFIQIITNDNSYNINFSKNQFIKNKNTKILIDNNIFSLKEINLDIKTTDFNVRGKINYYNLTPINNNIMGPFKFLPLECRHGIISMHHKINGTLEISGKIFDFTNGKGYIETDKGYSFPKHYVWIQTNDFDEKCSIMVAIANIPFLGFSFIGIICVVYYQDIEYRIATYNGAKILECTKNKIKIFNKNLRLEIDIPTYSGHSLYSPIQGKMIGIIKESPSCKARFRFYKANKLIFDMISTKTSCEFID